MRATKLWENKYIKLDSRGFIKRGWIKYLIKYPNFGVDSGSIPIHKSLKIESDLKPIDFEKLVSKPIRRS